MPITDMSLVWVGLPASSTAVAVTDAVRLVCAVNWNQSATPYPDIHPPHPPSNGRLTGFAYVLPLAGPVCATVLPRIRMSCATSDPRWTAITTGVSEPEGA